ncbi:unnamed protein product [Calypogeia fissa]
MSGMGMGVWSKRYSLLAENGVVKQLNIEESEDEYTVNAASLLALKTIVMYSLLWRKLCIGGIQRVFVWKHCIGKMQGVFLEEALNWADAGSLFCEVLHWADAGSLVWKLCIDEMQGVFLGSFALDRCRESVLEALNWAEALSPFGSFALSRCRESFLEEALHW